MKVVPIIEVIKLKKIYGMGDAEVAALNGVSLQILPNEFVAIMGPSGSGKSTLMNILGCLDHPTTGNYLLAGEDVSNLSRLELAQVRNQKLGFIFQSFNLLPRMTAVENVMLPMMYQHENPISLDERYERAMASLENVGLASRAHHHPNELSGGQQQRVAIARALVNDPILILADEPTGNLDTKSSLEILDILHNLNKRGRTIVMVTHEPGIAKQLDRIIRIRDGRIDSDFKNGNGTEKMRSKISVPESEQR